MELTELGPRESQTCVDKQDRGRKGACVLQILIHFPQAQRTPLALLRPPVLRDPTSRLEPQGSSSGWLA
jgi:hypothetical protein